MWLPLTPTYKDFQPFQDFLCKKTVVHENPWNCKSQVQQGKFMVLKKS